MKMDKKVLLALPLSFLSLVSCNGTEDIEWKDDAESIVVFGGETFDKREQEDFDGREAHIRRTDIFYCENGDVFYVKEEYKQYMVIDYQKGMEIDEDDMISKLTYIYKFKGVQYEITFEKNYWEKQ